MAPGVIVEAWGPLVDGDVCGVDLQETAANLARVLREQQRSEVLSAAGKHVEALRCSPCDCFCLFART
jgi:hypothetical protein